MATPSLVPAAVAFPGMPLQLGSSLQHVGRLAAGWVPHGTIPEIEDAVVNKKLFPVGASFLTTEKDRAVFFVSL